jgi:cyclophilin family peptidyl-prolyl cis-trans isomerase
MNTRKFRIVICRILGLALVITVFCQASRSVADSGAALPQVEIKTSMGTIVVKLDPVSAPRTCDAFLSYIHRDVYQGSAFYTVEAHDIQGGRPGFRAVGFSSSGNFFKDAPAGEFALKHIRGAVGLARTVGDCNPTKSTNSTQFYIMREDFPKDDGQYSIFAHVVRGMDVVDRIAGSLAADKNAAIKFDIVAL